jgi:DNA-directed RNA polymerase III subunit RPC8
MFVIVSIEDKLRTSPEDFDKDPEEVLIEQIEQKYANKVMVNVGLFIHFLDFKAVGDPYIYPSEGSAHQVSVFRMICFRPFLGEVINGTICNCSSEGVTVSLGFFEDILIPPHFLPQPSEYNMKLNSWIWKYEGNDFDIETGDEIRFKVKTIHYTRVTTTRGNTQATTISETNNKQSGAVTLPKGFSDDQNTSRTRSLSVDLSAGEKVPAVMLIIGSADELGLGNPVWW